MQHLTYRSDKPLLDPATLAAADTGMTQLTELLEQMALIDLCALMHSSNIAILSLPMVDYLDQYSNTEHTYDFDDLIAYGADYTEVVGPHDLSGRLGSLAGHLTSLARQAGLDPESPKRASQIAATGLMEVSTSDLLQAGGRDEYRLVGNPPLREAAEALTEHPAATLLAEVIRLGATRRS